MAQANKTWTYDPYDALRDSLADPTCTDWRCPECGRYEYKGAVNADTGEFLPFDLTCENCGFDATEYGPAKWQREI